MLHSLKTKFFSTSLLSEYESNRKNNFTILRFLFAWAVLIGHSFPITGNGSDPVSKFLIPYEWIGGIAVHGFFAISGYLVTASFMKRGAVLFIISRVLRLYPGIIVFCLLAIFIIGPLSANVSLETYFQANPWYYFLNASLWDWIYNLPYTFSENPLKGTNGSTWTLPVELRCYLLVLLLGFFGVFDSRIRTNVAILCLLILTKVNFPSIPLFGSSNHFVNPLTYFLLGSLFWVNRNFLPLNWLFAIALTAASFFAIKIGLYQYVYPICLTYMVFMLVYRTPHIDMDRLGDISYGVYIYAWPVQQMVWSEGQSAYANILISTCIVFPLAYISWTVVESPALNIRKSLSKKKIEKSYFNSHLLTYKLTKYDGIKK